MPSTERSLCVAVHDVAPATWPQCRRLLDMLDGYRLPLTLLVVPEFHHAGRIEDDPEFVAAIAERLARGDEVALHGLYHLDDSPPPRKPGDWIARRMLTQREGEFAALDEARCRERLDRGLSAMHRLGWPVSGFVAPAWLLGRPARAALTRSPLRYTTTRTGIYHLPEWSFTAAPALTYSARSAWRRAMSRALVEAQYAASRSQPLLRVALHPVDARHEHVVSHWRDLIGRALDERTPLTKAAWVARTHRPAQQAA
jgi:predicted deacetylase